MEDQLIKEIMKHASIDRDSALSNGTPRPTLYSQLWHVDAYLDISHDSSTMDDKALL